MCNNGLGQIPKAASAPWLHEFRTGVPPWPPSAACVSPQVTRAPARVRRGKAPPSYVARIDIDVRHYRSSGQICSRAATSDAVGCHWSVLRTTSGPLHLASSCLDAQLDPWPLQRVDKPAKNGGAPLESWSGN